MSKKKKKLKSISKLKKEADAVFSKFIRQRDKGICETCGVKKEEKYQQCGHYIPRSHMNTRYDEENCNCQCFRCNIKLKGNMDEYAIRLKSKYGTGILERLHKRKQIIRQFKRKDFEDLIAHYKNIISNKEKYE